MAGKVQRSRYCKDLIFDLGGSRFELMTVSCFYFPLKKNGHVDGLDKEGMPICRRGLPGRRYTGSFPHYLDLLELLTQDPSESMHAYVIEKLSAYFLTMIHTVFAIALIFKDEGG